MTFLAPSFTRTPIGGAPILLPQHFYDRAMNQNTREKISTLRSRLALATFGSTALILPMLIMVWEQSLTNRLVV